MFGLGWAEIMVAAVVGLIVIGPKELPVVFRKIGQFVGKAKGMAHDFSRAMNDAADDSGMKDALDSVNSLKDGVRSVGDPTTKWKDFIPGSETAELVEERTKKSKKMHDATTVKAQVNMGATQATSPTEDASADLNNGKKYTSNTPIQNKSVGTTVPIKPSKAKKKSTGSKKVTKTKNIKKKIVPNSGKMT